MVVNHAAENACGTIGTICWTVQVIPQIYKSFRTKSTEGLSEYLLLLWAVAGPFLGVYSIVQNLNIPLMIQPECFATLAAISWAQCLYYGRKLSRNTCILAWLGLLSVMAGFEVGMIYAVRPAFNKGNLKPVQFFGIFSSVIISLGLFPQYWEIYQHKEVIGISFTFMFVDWLGAVFSLLSLIFKEKFDVVAGITYSLVVVLDGIVLLAYFILNPIAKKRRQRQLDHEGSVEGTTVANTPERRFVEVTAQDVGKASTTEKTSQGEPDT